MTRKRLQEIQDLYNSHPSETELGMLVDELIDSIEYSHKEDSQHDLLMRAKVLDDNTVDMHFVSEKIGSAEFILIAAESIKFLSTIQSQVATKIREAKNNEILTKIDSDS